MIRNVKIIHTRRSHLGEGEMAARNPPSDNRKKCIQIPPLPRNIYRLPVVPIGHHMARDVLSPQRHLTVGFLGPEVSQCPRPTRGTNQLASRWYGSDDLPFY